MNNNTFRPAIIIPVFNHEQAIPHILAQVLTAGLPVLLVDDGSEAGCAAVLVALAEKHANVSLLRLAENGGKGAAVKAGLQWLLGNFQRYRAPGRRPWGWSRRGSAGA